MKIFIAIASVSAALLLPTLAQAGVVRYIAELSGPAEAPPNASPATGLFAVDYDDVAHTMHIIGSFSGLIGTVTAAHIHCCTVVADAGTAGVATVTPTFTGFPSGVTSGSYEFTYDMTLPGSYRAGFISANGGTAASAEAALFGGMAAGKSYFNIHTTEFPGGEIRGFLHVPEPSGLALSLLSLATLGGVLRRRSS